ncbi:hypothetical protein Tsp_03634 [Trichinella spiralis]|uniref:hypothetical protein n=1 Tax=Trichinella spiralis TaxID=6334 RepID=UPI0001EFBBFD|nr:hypothetical protein Tsp_03634 [Trichinella spiralis]
MERTMAWKIFAPVDHQYSFVIGRDMSKECGKSVVQDFLNSSNNQTILPEEYMPWSIEVKGYCQGKYFGYQRITCLGFLVISNKENAHSDVILTTASCLFKETNCIRFHIFNPVNNETVNVAFFTTMAKSFKGMDHDIALLFLQSPIQFSRRTWPICFSSMINSIADFMDDCIFIRRIVKRPFQSNVGQLENVKNRKAAQKQFALKKWRIMILNYNSWKGDGEAVMCRKDRRWFLKSVGGTSLSADKSMVKAMLCKHVVINYIPIDYQFKITNIVARINDQSKTSIDQQRRLLIFWLSEADSHWFHYVYMIIK